jgi:hypothetical protein
VTETEASSLLAWPDDRGDHWGRCRNDFYCALAIEGRVLHIEPGKRLVCPGCFKPLNELPDLAHRSVPRRKLWLGIGGGLATAALCLLVYRAAPLGGHAAATSVASLPSQNSARTAEVILAPDKLAPQQVIAYAELGSVPPAITVPGGGAQHAKLVILPGVPAAFRQTRGFSAQPIAGGEPAFPESVQSRPITGLVRVECRIEADGSPADCQAIAVRGGHSFRDSAMAWLKSGNVRFAPILNHGQPVAEVRSWDIEFAADPPD